MWELNDAVDTATTSAWNTTGGVHVPHKASWLHTSFYWGHSAQVLFSGWPGSSKGMYAVALVFVFSLAVLVEWLSSLTIVKPGSNKAAFCAFKLGLHAVRTGFSYMVMLSVMSFNGGVFLVAVFGHAFGFMLFGRFKKSGRSAGSDRTLSDLPTKK